MSTDITVKNQLRSLIDQANETTGKEDTDLTSAVGRLVEGYGKDSGLDITQYMTGLTNVFTNAIFPENTELTLYMPSIKNLSSDSEISAGYAFMYTKGVKKITLACDSADRERSVNFTQTFRNSSVQILDISEFSRKPSQMNYAFRYAGLLEQIVGELDLSVINSGNSVFQNCSKLIEVRFVQGTIKLSLSFSNSSLLSDASIQSIIDGLADKTDSTTSTLYVHSTVLTKITEEQWTSALNKNWNIE